MASIIVEIPGRPVPLERHRMNRGRAYLPKRSADWRRGAQLIMKAAMRGRKPLEGPLILMVTAAWKNPKSGPNKNANLHTIAPDASNILKAVEDAGNGILWKDDCQIWAVEMSKIYPDPPQKELVKLTVIQTDGDGYPLREGNTEKRRV